MKKKTFDCVDMMHKGAEKVLQEIQEMSPEQEMEYWQTQPQNLRERKRQKQEQSSRLATQHQDNG